MDIYFALAEPTRRAILDLLVERERSAGELVESFPKLTQPAVSRHLKVLLDVGLIQVRPEAQRRVYTLEPNRMLELDTWLERYRGFWDGHSQPSERHLPDQSPQVRRIPQPQIRQIRRRVD